MTPEEHRRNIACRWCKNPIGDSKISSNIGMFRFCSNRCLEKFQADDMSQEPRLGKYDANTPCKRCGNLIKGVWLHNSEFWFCGGYCYNQFIRDGDIIGAVDTDVKGAAEALDKEMTVAAFMMELDKARMSRGMLPSAPMTLLDARKIAIEDLNYALERALNSASVFRSLANERAIKIVMLQEELEEGDDE